MPVHLETRGGKHCVVEPSGTVLHCYDNEEDALAYLRAINMHSDKGIKHMEENTDQNSTTDSSVNNADIVYVSTDKIPESFSELEAQRKQKSGDSRVMSIIDDFELLSKNVVSQGFNVPVKLRDLVKEMFVLIGDVEFENVTEEVEETSEPDDVAEPKSEELKDVRNSFLIWKDRETGLYRWLGVYSNKFRDDDYPVKEILAEEAHKEFISRVNKGELDYPYLYVWHIPVSVGKADLLVYDDSGFSVCGGTFTNESVAKALRDSDNDLAMSHGMPAEFIERDKDDPSVITRYVSEEVSVLPRDAAANKRTGFKIIEAKEEKTMALDPELREKVVQMIGEDATLSIEADLERQGKKAVAAGIDFKQAGEEVEEEKESDETETEAEVTEDVKEEEEAEDKEEKTEVADEGEKADDMSEDEEEPETEDAEDTDEEDFKVVAEALRKEFVGMFGTIIDAIGENNKAISERLDALEQKFSELSQDEAEVPSEKAAGTTTASMASMLAAHLSGEQAKSVIGDPATRLHGNSKLANARPEENLEGVEEKSNGLFFNKWTMNSLQGGV